MAWHRAKSRIALKKELLFERWIPDIPNDQAAKRCSGAGPGASHNCGGCSSNKLGCYILVLREKTGLELPLDHLVWGSTLGRLFRWDLWLKKKEADTAWLDHSYNRGSSEWVLPWWSALVQYPSLSFFFSGLGSHTHMSWSHPSLIPDGNYY